MQAILEELGEEKLPAIPSPKYLPREWPEKIHIRAYLSARLASIPVEACLDKRTTLEALLDSNKDPGLDPPVPNRAITGSIHIKDLSGTSLLIKIASGIEEPFLGTPA